MWRNENKGKDGKKEGGKEKWKEDKEYVGFTIRKLGEEGQGGKAVALFKERI